MNIRTELDKLTTEDIYSMLMFVLYKSTDVPEYSSLSQLAYILDKDSLTKLCAFYGGLTITIPKIEQLNELLEGLLMVQMVDIQKKDFDEVSKKFNKSTVNTYFNIKRAIADYNFNSGRVGNEPTS